MLSAEFYDRFAAYEYVLIYQLDAFVFADRLAEFCQMGYDYIGAPVRRLTPLWHAIGLASLWSSWLEQDGGSLLGAHSRA